MIRLNSLGDIETGEAMGELRLFYLPFCQGISRASYVLRPMLRTSYLSRESEYLNGFEIHAICVEKRESKRRKTRCGDRPEKEQCIPEKELKL